MSAKRDWKPGKAVNAVMWTAGALVLTEFLFEMAAWATITRPRVKGASP